MVQYREAIIQQILLLNDTESAETIFDNTVVTLLEKGTHPFIMVRFFDKLKQTLVELCSGDITESEKNNLLNALQLLNNFDVTKSISKTQTRSK